MENGTPSAGTHEQACARVASRFRRPWLRHYVSGKLRSDPVFTVAYEVLRDSSERILDVGCGVGLLPFYLRERGFGQPITGLDIDARKVRAGNAVANASYERVTLLEHDVVQEEPAPFRGNVALFDLLHYLEPEVQQQLLRRLARCVPPGGLILIRDAPRDGSVRYWTTYLGEKFAQALCWNVRRSLYFPALEAIDSAFNPREWTRSQQPAWGRTPFNNRLFIYRRRASAAVPAPE